MTPIEVAECYHHEDITDYLLEKVNQQVTESKNAWFWTFTWSFLKRMFKRIFSFGCINVNDEEVEEDFNGNEPDEQLHVRPMTYESIANTWSRRRLGNSLASSSANLAMIC